MPAAGVASRRALVVALAAASVIVIARGALFMAPGVRLDADQAVVGLMAKHIAEGRAFPVYFYGQNYLLAVEAYLAAPLMWVLGPTEVALKLPVLAMNVVTAALLVWHAARGVGLTPWRAVVSATPFLLPPIVVGTRLMDAMGGNIETPFYALLLWTVRGRPWLFGVTTAIALANRELAAYPLAALAGLDLLAAGWRSPATRQRWALAGLCTATLLTALMAVRPFAAMFGPGTIARPMDYDHTSAEIVRAQLCFGPERWPSRGAQIAWEHLPLATGGQPGPLSAAGVSTGVGQGNPGAYPWVVVVTLAGLTAALGVRRATGDAAADGAVPAAWLPWFLMACGVLSTLVYGFVSCSQISPLSLRYNLLLVFVPAGAIMGGLRHPSRAVRAGLATALLLWIAVAADDYRALGREIAGRRWPDHRGDAVARLAARGRDAYWGDFRLSYVLTFRAAERFTVAPDESPRIDLYAERARVADAPRLQTEACAGGEAIAPGVWMCPMTR